MIDNRYGLIWNILFLIGNGIIIIGCSVLLALALFGCSTEHMIDRINGLPNDEIYYPPSKDSPAWAPYYDPELTDALNRP